MPIPTVLRNLPAIRQGLNQCVHNKVYMYFQDNGSVPVYTIANVLVAPLFSSTKLPSIGISDTFRESRFKDIQKAALVDLTVMHLLRGCLRASSSRPVMRWGRDPGEGRLPSSAIMRFTVLFIIFLSSITVVLLSYHNYIIIILIITVIVVVVY